VGVSGHDLFKNITPAFTSNNSEKSWNTSARIADIRPIKI